MAQPIDLTTTRDRGKRVGRTRPALARGARATAPTVQLEAGRRHPTAAGASQAALAQSLSSFFPTLIGVAEQVDRRKMAAQKIEDGRRIAEAEAAIRANPDDAKRALQSGQTGAFFGEDVASRRVVMDAAARSIGTVSAAQDMEKLKSFLGTLPSDVTLEDGVALFVEAEMDGAENAFFKDSYSAALYAGARPLVNDIREARQTEARAEATALAHKNVTARLQQGTVTLESLPVLREETMATLPGNAAERTTAADAVVYSALEERYIQGDGQAARLLTAPIPGRDGLSYRDLYPNKFRSATVSSIERAGRAKTTVQKARALALKHRFAQIEGGVAEEGDDLRKLQLDVLQEMGNGYTDELGGLAARIASARESGSLLGGAIDDLAAGRMVPAAANDKIGEAWANGQIAALASDPEVAEVAVTNHISKVGLSKKAREQASQGIITGDAGQAQEALSLITPVMENSTAPDTAFLTEDAANIAFLAKHGPEDFETARQNYLESRADLGNVKTHLARRLFGDDAAGDEGVDEIAEEIFEAAHPSNDTFLWWFNTQRDWEDVDETVRQLYRDRANAASVALHGQPGITREMVAETAANAMEGKSLFDTMYMPDGEKHAVPRKTPLGLEQFNETHWEQLQREQEQFLPGMSVGVRPDKHSAGDGMYAATMTDATGANTDIVFRTGDVIEGIAKDDPLLPVFEAMGSTITSIDEERVMVEVPALPENAVMLPLGKGAGSLFMTNTGGQWALRVLPRDHGSVGEINDLMTESAELTSTIWANEDAIAAAGAGTEQRRGVFGSTLQFTIPGTAATPEGPRVIEGQDEDVVINTAPAEADQRIFEAPNMAFTPPMRLSHQRRLEEERADMTTEARTQGMSPTMETGTQPEAQTLQEAITEWGALSESYGQFMENTLDPKHAGRMKTLVEQLEVSELFRPGVYDDANQQAIRPGQRVRGNMTVGIGYNITAREANGQAAREMAQVGLDLAEVKAGRQRLSRPQAEALARVAMQNDLNTLRTDVLPEVRMADHRWMALSSLAYNVGVGAMRNWHLMDHVRNGAYEEATREIALNIDTVDPKWKEGIVRRRYLEAVMFWGSYPLPASIPSPADIGAEAQSELPKGQRRHIQTTRLERNINADREAMMDVFNRAIRRQRR